MRIQSDQRGVALLLVLMCLSILTFIVLDHLPQSSLTLEAAKGYAAKPQLERAALNGASLAAKILLADLDDNSFDALSDRWADPAATRFIFEESEITITFAIHDEDGKWPLNALHTQNSPATENGKKTDKNIKKVVKKGAATIDKRHRDILEALFNDVEDGDSMTEGIVAAIQATHGHRFFRLASLQQVKGVDLIYDGIEAEGGDEQGDNEQKWQLPPLSHIMSVYSARNTVNINTAPLYLLKAIFRDASPSAVEEIVEKRQMRPYESTKDLQNISGISPAELTKVRPLLGVSSSFFRVDVKAELGDHQLLRSLFLKREAEECRLLFWRDNAPGFEIDESAEDLDETEDIDEAEEATTEL